MQDLLKDYVIEDLVVMYQSTKRDLILEEIIKRNEGLIYSWVRDYRNIPNYDEEDLVEEAVIACWSAVEHFEINRGITFSSCLKGFVKQRFNRLYMEVTRKKRFTGQEPISYESLEEIHKEASIEVKVLSELEVQEFINSLDGKMKEVAVNLIHGYSKTDIAKALHIAPASISYHVKRIGQAYMDYRGDALRG